MIHSRTKRLKGQKRLFMAEPAAGGSQKMVKDVPWIGKSSITEQIYQMNTDTNRLRDL